jgi:hypothetical protein
MQGQINNSSTRFRKSLWREARLGKRIGKLNAGDTVRLNRALTVFLGLAR